MIEEIKQIHKNLQLFNIERAVRKWISMQGHDKCWYYPEIFQEIIDILEIKEEDKGVLLERNEFEKGCKRYQDELYK